MKTQTAQINEAQEKLRLEANRFTQLTKEFALKTLINGGADDARVAKEHLVRAETFREAATVIGK